jgi:hypothetical protein
VNCASAQTVWCSITVGAERRSPDGAVLEDDVYQSGAHASIDLLTPGSTSTIIHQVLKASGSEESSGRNVCSMSCFDVATGLMGGARGTTMANVKAAI